MAAERRYESTFIVDGNLQDEAIESLITRVTDIITKNGGTIVEIERWGRRKLAYEIEKVTTGYYTSIHFNAPSGTIAKLDRHYQLDEQIMRWLTLVMPETNIRARAQMKKRVEDLVARKAAEAKAAEAAEAAEAGQASEGRGE
jgi:small subunit ribosomal protein S6